MTGAPRPRRLVQGEILDAVCEEFQMTAAAVCGDCRHVRFVVPRHVFVHIAVEQFGYSAAAAGRVIGKDHTTAGDAMRSIAARMQTDEELAERVSRLKADLALKARMPVPQLYSPRSRQRPKPPTLDELLAFTPELPSVKRSVKALRSRQWSVRSISDRLGVDPRIVAYLLGVQWENAA